MAERWDREWITYFRRGSYFFVDCSCRTMKRGGASSRVRAALRPSGSTSVVPVSAANPVWDIWAIACLPEEIADRDVADLGCGPGQLGRTISYVTRSYLGVDYSPLALRVAQLVSPPQAEFVVRTDADGLARRRGSVDTAFSRHVFIHQNFQQAVELAQVAADLLRGGGVLAVDFHRPEVDGNGEFLKPPWLAKGDLDPEHPSRGFYFTDAEIAEVGRAARAQARGDHRRAGAQLADRAATANRRDRSRMRYRISAAVPARRLRVSRTLSATAAMASQSKSSWSVSTTTTSAAARAVVVGVDQRHAGGYVGGGDERIGGRRPRRRRRAAARRRRSPATRGRRRSSSCTPARARAPSTR